MLTERALILFYIAVPYRRHHPVDNLLCNRTRYWTFVRSSASYSVVSFFGCLRSTKRPSTVHCGDPIKLYDFFMYFIGQVSATVVLSALWPLFILIAHMILVFRLLCSHFRLWPLLRPRCACVCVSHVRCTYWSKNAEPPNRIYEYFLFKPKIAIVLFIGRGNCTARRTLLELMLCFEFQFYSGLSGVPSTAVAHNNRCEKRA